MTRRTWRTPIQRLTASMLRGMPIPWQRQRIANQVGKLLSPKKAQERDIGKTQYGFKMHLNLGDVFQRSIYFGGAYELAVSHLFTRLIAPGDVVVDGGANIGYFTLLAATRVGEAGSVHSFEPVPATFDALVANVALNDFKNVHTNREALSDRAGELEFEVPLDTATGQPLGWAATQVLMGRGPKITVSARALDEYVAGLGLQRIKLAKLDLEGGELAAITGMQQLLAEQRIQYLVTEVNSFLLDPLGIPRDAQRRALAGHGYRCFRVNEGPFGRPRLREVTGSGKPDSDAEYLFVAPGLPIPQDT